MIFKGENILYGIIILDIFIKIHRITTSRVNFNVNYGHWVIMMCQFRFINCNKCTTLLGYIYNDGVYGYVGVGLYRKSLYCPSVLLLT